ncbi:DUF7146 domain-containing protein [Sphingomonas oryzagri]
MRKLGGHWHDDRGMCLCPCHEDRTPSLSVRIGRSTLLFKCFAGCDTLDVLRAIRRLDLVLPGRTRDRDDHRSSLTERPNSRAAERIWQAATGIEATPGARYLHSRGLAPPWADLRYHPRTPLGGGRSVVFRPAIVAAIREGKRFTAIHRTFLDARTASKAPDLDTPRRMLGRPAHGAVQLARPSTILGLAEGIETALAAMQIHRIPVWATLGAERAGRIRLPDRLERLVLLFDNDPAGWKAEQRAREAYRHPGLSILTRWPPANDDWAELVDPRGQPGRAA